MLLHRRIEVDERLLLACHSPTEIPKTGYVLWGDKSLKAKISKQHLQASRTLDGRIIVKQISNYRTGGRLHSLHLPGPGSAQPQCSQNFLRSGPSGSQAWVSFRQNAIPFLLTTFSPQSLQNLDCGFTSIIALLSFKIESFPTPRLSDFSRYPRVVTQVSNTSRGEFFCFGSGSLLLSPPLNCGLISHPPKKTV